MSHLRSKRPSPPGDRGALGSEARALPERGVPCRLRRAWCPCYLSRSKGFWLGKGLEPRHQGGGWGPLMGHHHIHWGVQHGPLATWEATWSGTRQGVQGQKPLLSPPCPPTPAPWACTLPVRPRPYQAPPTSSSAGFASSVRTATAPGPRAAAGGGGGARRTPLCTRPSLPSSGPQAGPPRLPPASLGSGPLSQPASPCPTLTAGPGVASAWGLPCLSPPQGGGLRALAALAAGNPRPAHTSSGAQGNWGGSRDQGDQRRQQGAQRTSRGGCARLPALPGSPANSPHCDPEASAGPGPS